MILRRIVTSLLSVLALTFCGSGVVGWIVAPDFQRPTRLPMSQELVDVIRSDLSAAGARMGDVTIEAPDRTVLRGWKVVSAHPNGSWVLLFHGVGDNRAGMAAYAEFLARAGYGAVLMDSRGHGESGGTVSYGWIERQDASATLDWLFETEHPRHVFALGESMGAGIALQSAAADARIEAVVAESPFASLREAAYDYAGLQESVWLGKTVFAPGAWVMIYRAKQLTGWPISEISPEKSVASGAFPVFLICDEDDRQLPCRHAERIFASARGKKELWSVPHAGHTGAYGANPEEFRKRVLDFFSRAAATCLREPAPSGWGNRIAG